MLTILMFIQNLVRFGQFVLKLLSRNKTLTSVKGHNSVKILRKMTGNIPKKDLVNVNVHTKFDQILTYCSLDIEGKRNSDINQVPKRRQNFAKNDRLQSQA